MQLQFSLDPECISPTLNPKLDLSIASGKLLDCCILAASHGGVCFATRGGFYFRAPGLLNRILASTGPSNHQVSCTPGPSKETCKLSSNGEFDEWPLLEILCNFQAGLARAHGHNPVLPHVPYSMVHSLWLIQDISVRRARDCCALIGSSSQI